MNNTVTNTMIMKARQRWPYTIDFDFVKCSDCDFIGLVALGKENCPSCKKYNLSWANENQKEFSL